VVTINTESIYFAGDTDHIPEMADIECDIALLPVSGTYVMTAEEAAQAAEAIRPQVAVPMHYGAGVAGTASDAQRFEALYDGEVFVFSDQ
jgi:L-ascorbate metabolism protein UlaG (beta-lactamase superfamily)